MTPVKSSLGTISQTYCLGRLSNISLDRTGDAGRVWRDCCMLRMVRGQGGAWPRPISSRALGGKANGGQHGGGAATRKVTPFQRSALGFGFGLAVMLAITSVFTVNNFDYNNIRNGVAAILTGGNPWSAKAVGFEFFNPPFSALFLWPLLFVNAKLVIAIGGAFLTAFIFNRRAWVAFSWFATNLFLWILAAGSIDMFVMGSGLLCLLMSDDVRNSWGRIILRVAAYGLLMIKPQGGAFIVVLYVLLARDWRGLVAAFLLYGLPFIPLYPDWIRAILTSPPMGQDYSPLTISGPVRSHVLSVARNSGGALQALEILAIGGCSGEYPLTLRDAWDTSAPRVDHSEKVESHSHRRSLFVVPRRSDLGDSPSGCRLLPISGSPHGNVPHGHAWHCANSRHLPAGANRVQYRRHDRFETASIKLGCVDHSAPSSSAGNSLPIDFRMTDAGNANAQDWYSIITYDNIDAQPSKIVNCLPPNISLDRTGDAGRIWRDCCMLGVDRGPVGEWPRPISSRALGGLAQDMHDQD